MRPRTVTILAALSLAAGIALLVLLNIYGDAIHQHFADRINRGDTSVGFVARLVGSSLAPAVLLVVLVVVPSGWLLSRIFGPGAKPDTCPTCGYDLRATPGRCPECGRNAESASKEVGA